ncbi:MAG: signal peptidase II [Patescibacteria group bacterium]|jgi:signal peptidase II
MKKESKQLMFINVGFFFLFVADRVLKWWAVNSLSDISPITFLRVFRLEFYLNEGIIFSVPLPKTLIYIITVLIISIVIYLLYEAYQMKSRTLIIGYSLVAVGAFSNLLDRINHGAIIDFINLTVLPVFNLADCLITAGAIILILKVSNRKGNNYEKVH